MPWFRLCISCPALRIFRRLSLKHAWRGISRIIGWGNPHVKRFMTTTKIDSCYLPASAIDLLWRRPPFDQGPQHSCTVNRMNEAVAIIPRPPQPVMTSPDHCIALTNCDVCRFPWGAQQLPLDHLHGQSNFVKRTLASLVKPNTPR